MNESVLDPAGLTALHTSSLWWVLFWVSTGVFAVVALALGYAMWRPRARVAEPAIDAHPGDEVPVWRFLFHTVVLIALTLLGLLIADYRTATRVMDSAAPADPQAVTIEVTARQWWWEVRYPDATPSQLVTTANELHIPVGRTVHLRLDSHDVIHSFWVPNLSGKKDMIPGIPTATWLRAERAGTFRGQCAEFCGLQHAHMGLTVVAEEPEKFQAWVEAQRAPAPAPRTARQQAGREVFAQKSCVLCHRILGEPASATVGPDLTHFASRATLASALPNTREHLAAWILEPARTKPGVLMPPTPLSKEELEALLDYLTSLR